MIYGNQENLSLDEFMTSQHESILNTGNTLAQEHEVEDIIAERITPEIIWEQVK